MTVSSKGAPAPRRRSSRTARAVLTTLIAGAALTGLHGSPARADTVSDEQQFVNLINPDRVAAGLQPLAVHPALVASGRAWAAKMLTASIALGGDGCLISHNPDLRTAVAASWRKLGENVGCGDVDAAFLHQKFMQSPAHRANIMDPQYDSVGIGLAMGDGGVMFVTEQFMDVEEPAATSTVPPSLALKVPAAQVKGVALGPIKKATTVRPTTKRKVS